MANSWGSDLGTKGEIQPPTQARIGSMDGVNGTTRHDDEVVVVHVDRDLGPCRSCGSANVLRIRVSEEEDSPLWVSMCADCDEHVWSLDS